MTSDTPLIIDGERVPGKGASLAIVNPATGDEIAVVDTATRDQVDDAVAAAGRALSGAWGRMDGFERRRRIGSFAQGLLEAAAEIGATASAEMGMPIGFATGEAMAAADYVAHFAGYADKISGRTASSPLPDVHLYTLRQPAGVVAALSAWNSPSMIPAFKLGPALAAGCTLVMKPSELAPRTARLMADVALESDLPAGVVNCVVGGAAIGEHLVSHRDVATITFTGGGTVARKIGAVAGDRFAKTLFELGGKSATLVFDDANLDHAAAGAGHSVFMLAGQMCVAGSRILVQREIFDEFVAELSRRAEKYLPGDPADFETQAGPLISEAAIERVQGFVDGAVADGAELVCGGERIDAPGFFYEPTIITGVSNSDPICQEEVFGPVVVVMPFDTEAEAVDVANASRYGLVANIWTQDLARAHRVAKNVEAGSAWVNASLVVTPDAPFGGWKESGLGREGGIEAVYEFTEIKTVHMGGIY